MRGHGERLHMRVVGHDWAPLSALKGNEDKWRVVGGIAALTRV